MLHFEPVEGNGFYVNDQLVPPGVDLLTPAGCLYKVKAIFVSDVCFLDWKKKLFGVLKEDDFL